MAGSLDVQKIGLAMNGTEAALNAFGMASHIPKRLTA
jgi:hypothetical protein